MEKMTQEKAIELVSKLLKVEVSELESKSLEGDGYRVYQPIRGGRSVIVANDGSVLFANSSVSPVEHESAFKEGKRTDPSLF